MRPVPGFGDPDAAVLVLGLAPAAHGGNRTGRIFTGDRSGDFLYAGLYRAGAVEPTDIGGPRRRTRPDRRLRLGDQPLRTAGQPALAAGAGPLPPVPRTGARPAGRRPRPPRSRRVRVGRCVARPRRQGPAHAAQTRASATGPRPRSARTRCSGASTRASRTRSRGSSRPGCSTRSCTEPSRWRPRRAPRPETARGPGLTACIRPSP